jgi:hypothetical protein
MADIASLFAALWADYTALSPSAARIHDLLGGGAPIVNDHIALRTFALPGIGLEVLGAHFLALGYVEGGNYRFVQKKLRAKHYQHPDASVPKVFISELLLDECSAALRERVGGLLAQMDMQRARAQDILYSGRHWSLAHQDYTALLEESEYAAWLAAFGFRANHFTVSVNQLPGFESLAEVNQRLKDAGFALNAAGGEIKGSPEVFLEQSSTLADVVPVVFNDGEYSIPSCFYEFAFRHQQPDGALYQGFVEASADRIFESTNAR